MIELKKDDKQEQRDQEIEHLRVALKEAHEKIRALVAELEKYKHQMFAEPTSFRTKIEGEFDV